MNDINEMPPKCQYCPYWEVCEYPWVCPDREQLATNLQQTCNQLATDTINRQAAIEAFRESLCASDTESGREYGISFSGAERILKSLPSAQPQWIPCNETVDIPDHEVLACDKYGEMIIGYLVYDEQWICESETQFMYDPIAWLPLPEPIREGDNK